MSLRCDGDDSLDRAGDAGVDRDSRVCGRTSKYCGGWSFASDDRGNGRTEMSMTSPLNSLATAATHALSDMRTGLRSPLMLTRTLNEMRSRETADNSSWNSFCAKSRACYREGLSCLPNDCNVNDVDEPRNHLLALRIPACPQVDT